MIADDVGNGSDRVEVMACYSRNAPVTILFSKMLTDILDLFFLEMPVKKWSADSASECALAIGALVAQRPELLLRSPEYQNRVRSGIT